MDTHYRVSVIDRDIEFSNLKTQWQALEQSDSETTPFNTHDWLSLWWKHYKQPIDQLHIIQFFLEDELVALAPMYISPYVQLKIVREKELRWLGSGGDTSPDYLNIIAMPEHRIAVSELLAEVIASLEGVQRVHLTDIVKPSSLLDILNKVLSKERGYLVSNISNQILTAELPDTWDEFRMALSRKRRKQINHRKNRLDQAGDWSLTVCSTEEQRHQAVVALEELHRLRWVSKGAPGGFDTDAYIQFHRDVIDKFAEKNQLWLVTLTVNDEIVGVLYLFLWRSTLYFFQSGFSPAHESLSPGHVMFTYVINEAIEQGIKHIDLLKGDYKYKTVYAKIVRVTTNVVYAKPGVGNVVTRSKGLVKRMCRIS